MGISTKKNVVEVATGLAEWRNGADLFSIYATASGPGAEIVLDGYANASDRETESNDVDCACALDP